MSQTADEILEAAMVLDAADRLRIAEELLVSVDSATVFEDVADSDLAEFRRRLGDLRSGAVAGLTSEQVFARLGQVGRP